MNWVVAVADAEAFFDADPDQDGEGARRCAAGCCLRGCLLTWIRVARPGEMTTDNILSQLDAVTNLDGWAQLCFGIPE